MYHYEDDASVPSQLSGENYAPAYDISMYPGPIHPHPQYFHPLMYAHQPPPVQPEMYSPAVHETEYVPNYGSAHFERVNWSGHAQNVAQQGKERTYQPAPGTPGGHGTDEAPASSGTYPLSGQFYTEVPTPVAHGDGDHTPYKYSPGSPYWGHLDHTTLAMMGIATPQGMAATPQTPSRGLHSSCGGQDLASEDDPNAASSSAQPLLLRQQYPVYGYCGSSEGYGPPSPATQFMMSPQANFGYGYSAYAGFSPNQMALPSQSFQFVYHDGVPLPESGIPATVNTPSKAELEDQPAESL